MAIHHDKALYGRLQSMQTSLSDDDLSAMVNALNAEFSADTQQSADTQSSADALTNVPDSSETAEKPQIGKTASGKA